MTTTAMVFDASAIRAAALRAANRVLQARQAAGMGQGDVSEAIVRSIANRVADSLVKWLKKGDPMAMRDLIRATAEGVEPTVRRVVHEDILPKALLWGALSLVIVGILAAFIGASTATKAWRHGRQMR